MGRYCENCGHELEEGSKFCAECGAPCAPHGAMDHNETIQSKGTRAAYKSVAVKVIVGVLAAVVIGGSVYVGVSYLGSTEKQAKKENIAAGEATTEDVLRNDQKVSEKTESVDNDMDVDEVVTDDMDENVVASEPKVDFSNLDVEAEVATIRDWYYGTQDNLSTYSQVQNGQNTYYYDGGTLVKIVVANGFNGWGYSREYFYHNGEFYFAFVYNGTEEHRLYFKEGTMIRYIDEYKNIYDYGNTAAYSGWEEKVKSEADNIKTK